MKKLFYIVLLVVSLTGSCNKQITTIAITTSPIIDKTLALEATKAIISNPDKSAESEPSEPYTKNNTINNTIEKESKDAVKILKNSITIPNVCNNAEITVGSTQESIDNYDICLMTEAAAIFGQGQPVLLGGHNTRSLKFLYKAKTNNIINVTYLGVEYQYGVIYSNECINDGYRLFDINSGKNMLEYNSDEEILQIYTCYNSNNWLVKAIKI